VRCENQKESNLSPLDYLCLFEFQFYNCPCESDADKIYVYLNSNFIKQFVKWVITYNFRKKQKLKGDRVEFNMVSQQLHPTHRWSLRIYLQIVKLAILDEPDVLLQELELQDIITITMLSVCENVIYRYVLSSSFHFIMFNVVQLWVAFVWLL